MQTNHPFPRTRDSAWQFAFPPLSETELDSQSSLFFASPPQRTAARRAFVIVSRSERAQSTVESMRGWCRKRERGKLGRVREMEQVCFAARKRFRIGTRGGHARTEKDGARESTQETGSWRAGTGEVEKERRYARSVGRSVRPFIQRGEKAGA